MKYIQRESFYFKATMDSGSAYIIYIYMLNYMAIYFHSFPHLKCVCCMRLHPWTDMQELIPGAVLSQNQC